MSEEDNTEVELASFRANGSKIQTMLSQSSIGSNGTGMFAELYVNVRDGLVNVVGSDSTASTFSFCSFSEPYLEDTTVTDNAAPLEEGENPSAQAVIPVGRFLEYMGIGDSGGTFEVDLLGDEGAEYAKAVRISGALNCEFYIPHGGLDVPLSLVEQFNEEERFEIRGEGQLSTHIDTESSTFGTIIDAVEMDNSLRYYPINVENGSLTVNTSGDDRRDSVYGNLEGEVEGPDASGDYKKGVEEVFSTLSGRVEVGLNDGDSPMSVVQDNVEGRTVRYVLGPSAE